MNQIDWLSEWIDWSMSIDRFIDSTDWFIEMIDRFGRMVEWIDWSSDRLIDWLIDRLGWLIYWKKWIVLLIDWLIELNNLFFRLIARNNSSNKVTDRFVWLIDWWAWSVDWLKQLTGNIPNNKNNQRACSEVDLKVILLVLQENRTQHRKDYSQVKSHNKWTVAHHVGSRIYS